MTKIKYIKRTIFLMILVLAASCEEIIEVPVGSNAPSQLVIYGYITNEAKRHSVRVSHSVGFSYSDIPVSDAIVTISDCDETFFEVLEYCEEYGVYLTAEDVRGEEGKTYTLEVTTKDGQKYSADALMPVMHDIISLEFQAPETISEWFNENFMGLRVHIKDVKDLPEENNYTVFVSLNDSALNSTIDRFSVAYSLDIDMPSIFFRLYNEDDPPRGRDNDDDDDNDTLLRNGDIVTVNINAISREYATFISTAQTELSGSIPIFSGPPANVRSNITDENERQVLGFFTAFSGREASKKYEEKE